MSFLRQLVFLSLALTIPCSSVWRKAVQPHPSAASSATRVVKVYARRDGRRHRAPPPGSKFEAVTNSSGAFTVPALSAGVYTVTFSLGGFKTRAISDVRVQLAIPTTLNAAPRDGEVSETITVSGAGARVDQHHHAGRDPTLDCRSRLP